MTSYKNFIADFGFIIQKYPPAPNLSKIKPISWQICKFLHFSIKRHIHNKRLPWQHRRLMRIVITYKMTPIGVRINFRNFIVISYAFSELLRKVSQGGRNPPPPCQIGLRSVIPQCLNSINDRHPGVGIIFSVGNFIYTQAM